MLIPRWSRLPHQFGLQHRSQHTPRPMLHLQHKGKSPLQAGHRDHQLRRRSEDQAGPAALVFLEGGVVLRGEQLHPAANLLRQGVAEREDKIEAILEVGPGGQLPGALLHGEIWR